MTRDALAVSTARAVLSHRLIHLLYYASENPTLPNTSTPAAIGNGLSLVVAHLVVTHSCRPSRSPSHIVLFTGHSAQSGGQCRLASHETPLRASRDRTRARYRFALYAAWWACSRCQRRSRFQHISASLRATATRAIFALDRFRTRV